jgi:hypothetical protein
MKNRQIHDRQAEREGRDLIVKLDQQFAVDLVFFACFDVGDEVGGHSAGFEPVQHVRRSPARNRPARTESEETNGKLNNKEEARREEEERSRTERLRNREKA